MKSIAILVFSMLFYYSFSQNCNNIGFELGDFTNWTGYTGSCCGGQINTPGIVNGWHTIMFQNGTDSNSNNQISYLAPGGGKYSVRLGNPNVGGQAERLRNTFQVSNNNTRFTYKYAVILEDPSGHSHIDKPKFLVKFYDQNNQLLSIPCANYDVTSGATTDSWQKNGDIRYKDWTSVTLDLRPYLGQNITVEFTTEDCGQGGHFGYAYIDATCGNFDIKISDFCNNPDSITLTAPEGYISYYWLPGRETTRIIKLSNPSFGDTNIVEMVNEAGCSTTVIHVLEDVSLPVATVSGDTTICYGDRVMLSSGGAGYKGSYYWLNDFNSDTSFEQFPIVSPGFKAIYTVHVRNSNGCFGPKSSASVTVKVNRNVFFYFYDLSRCIGDTITLNGPPNATTYSWKSLYSPGFSSSDSSITVIINGPAKYYLTASDSNCSFSDSVSIGIPYDFVEIYFCEGDINLILNAPYLAKSYFWPATGDRTSSTNITNPQDNTTYKVYMTESQGCYDTFTFKVRKAVIPIPTVSNDITICVGSDVQLFGGSNVSKVTYYWSSNPSGFHSNERAPFVSPDTTTRYFLRINNHNCWSNSVKSVLVTVNSVAKFDLGKNLKICYGDTVQLKSGKKVGSFLWKSSIDGTISYDSIITISPRETAVYSLLYIYQGCPFTDEIEISLFHRPNHKIVDFCINDNIVILTAPDSFATYHWLNTGQKSQSIIIAYPKHYELIPLYYTMNQGCDDTFYFRLNEIPNSIASVGNDTIICDGDSVVLWSHGTGRGISYQWTSNPPGFNSNLRNPLVIPKQNTIYTVKVLNELGCYGPQSIKSMKVSFDSSIYAELGPDIAICFGTAATLSSQSGSGDFIWSSDDTSFHSFSKTIIVNPNQTTRYYLRINSQKCQGPLDSILVVVNYLPRVEVGNSMNICQGDSSEIEVNEIPGASYLWILNNDTISDQSAVYVKPDKTTSYVVYVTDLNGCQGKGNVYVGVWEYPEINLGDMIKTCDEDSVKLDGGIPAEHYVWSTNETTRFIYIIKSGHYSVEAYNYKCRSFDEINVEIIKKNTILEIPNVITPDGDGLNDRFIIKIDNYQNYNLKIYNRWGQLLFLSNDVDNQWDGTVIGGNVPEDVYYYIFVYGLNCVEEFFFKEGTITIIR